MPKIFKMFGNSFEADIGKYATQADGSVWLKSGDNVVLATVVVADKVSEDLDFLPLTVECRERLSAVGKVPGGFVKREGRLSDSEILLSRIIDRSIRPLFPKFFFKEVQVMVTLLSYDGTIPFEVLGVLASSLAIVSAGIPFLSPVGAVVCAREAVGADWKINPSSEILQKSKDKVLVVGSAAGVCMVEASCDFVSEEDIVALVDGQASAEIKSQIDWQTEVIKQTAGSLNSYEPEGLSKEAQDSWIAKIESVIPENVKDYVFADSKKEFSEKNDFLKKVIADSLSADISESGISKVYFNMLVESVLKKLYCNIVVAEGKRFDHRRFDEVRNISSEVDVLPKSHGSAVFNRGETQVLSSLTLAASGDAQRVETLLYGVQDKHFMLHYNFPPFATGEVKPLRGVGRREIGHGYLAEKSFQYVLPSFEVFPYTIRSLVDVLGSNGSSSMATVCATTLALMDAGVPIARNVAGIAMGLLRSSQNNGYVVLTDITGKEDAFGFMDLKVVGDDSGITALQVDVKGSEYLTGEILRDALVAARKGLVHISSKMKECLSEPRKTLKDSAPRFFSMKVNPSKIGMIIGPGGKNIKQITADTGTQIDINESGSVNIFANDGLSAKKAESWIRALIGDIKNGSCYLGKVSKVVDFGVFVSIVPGKDGLIHISAIDRSKREKLDQLLQPGDPLDVVVVNVDPEGKIKLVAPSLEATDNGSLD